MPQEPEWLTALAEQAPDLVVPYREYRDERFVVMKQAVKARSGPDTALGLAGQHAAVAAHLDALLARADGALLAAPGGEGDWNVAQALGHTIAAREGLVLAAMLAATGRWPADAPTVVPGVPGPVDATGAALRASLARSQRFIERASTRIAGREADPCELRHPLVGHFRCGGWLLFAGVHDLMHVEQLERLLAR